MEESQVCIKLYSDTNFTAEALNSSVPVVVDFMATWCGPCKTLAAIIEDIAVELKGKIIVGKVNIDESPKTAAQYGIFSVPALLFIKDGRVVDQHIGLIAKKALLAKTNKVFGIS